MNRQKVSVGIEFPIDDLFDFSPYVRGPTDQSLLYKLYAVDNHFGSLYSGHCTFHFLVMIKQDCVVSCFFL